MSMKPYRPSNGTEGLMFMEVYCFRCKRDARFQETGDGEDGCPIIADTMLYEVTDPKYPKEWVWNPSALTRDGYLSIGGREGARCAAFEAMEE